MVAKPEILMIDSTIHAIDHQRRRALEERFRLLSYDCDSDTQFIERLQPGGPYSNVIAIIRGGWLKAGPYASHLPFGPQVVPHFPRSLKLICCSGHGFDAADIDAITARGIWYCNTPNACTEAVANTAVSLVLDTFRLLTYAQWCARNDHWLSSRKLGDIATDPAGKTLGIVGLGDIGLAIAQKCEAAFGMKIHYYGPRRKEQAEKTLKTGATYHASVEDMIPEIDCIVLAAPYTPETRHMLSKPQFDLAKKGGLRVVNIARGKMLDEDALLEALDDGRLVGVGLDVHENEPGVNPRLANNHMVTLLPHIGVCSRTSWENFEKINLDNVEAFFRDGMSFLIIGAGVIGLTTALELRARYPNAKIDIAAKYWPGDSAPEYASAWGGANWFPASNDNGPQEHWDAITYRKFRQLSSERPESGIRPMNIRFCYDDEIENVGILTPATGKLWFDELVGGLEPLGKSKLPAGAVFGCRMASFVIDVQKFLPWLQAEALRLGIKTHRRVFYDIREAFKLFPDRTAIFNCTGLDSLTLRGVEDRKVYPARGQILLVQGPDTPIREMAFRAPVRGGEATHIFPRGEGGRGGVILGGCRQKDDWDGRVDHDFAEVIKARCCALVPELGRPEDLRVIKHGVGLRPCREGGARIEAESIDGQLVIHNYGAGGTGFQASWGMAQYAVDLVPCRSHL